MSLQKQVADVSFVLKDSDMALILGVEWLSGRVLNSRLMGCVFEPH